MDYSSKKDVDRVTAGWENEPEATMNLLAIVGSARRGKVTDLLVDQAIEGAQSIDPECRVKKLTLIDYDIQFCRNCLACRDSRTSGPVAQCVIRDDMDWISQDLLNADALIIGTPVHMGFAPALLSNVLERVCWTFAKPERKVFTITGCPMPRSNKPRKAIIIVTSGVVPPLFRFFCDKATFLVKTTIKDSLNARTIGDLYAGDIEHRGVERYLDQALRLGQRLARA